MLFTALYLGCKTTDEKPELQLDQEDLLKKYIGTYVTDSIVLHNKFKMYTSNGEITDPVVINKFKNRFNSYFSDSDHSITHEYTTLTINANGTGLTADNGNVSQIVNISAVSFGKYQDLNVSFPYPNNSVSLAKTRSEYLYPEMCRSPVEIGKMSSYGLLIDSLSMLDDPYKKYTMLPIVDGYIYKPLISLAIATRSREQPLWSSKEYNILSRQQLINKFNPEVLRNLRANDTIAFQESNVRFLKRKN